MKQIKNNEINLKIFNIDENISYNFLTQFKRYLEFNFFYSLLDDTKFIPNN